MILLLVKAAEFNEITIFINYQLISVTENVIVFAQYKFSYKKVLHGKLWDEHLTEGKAR